MIVNYQAKPEVCEQIAEVLHVNGSSRIQTVTELQNPIFYRLLLAFEQKSGLPLLLNTSFNTHGKPIVTTPQDALAVLFTTDLDAVVIDNCLLEKRRH
jgi:carbamoyltransferase